ncbi:unnamed protein product [Trichobilharzia regenti]|nr:unnamed protein product [Trichobilharzia regenti]
MSKKLFKFTGRHLCLTVPNVNCTSHSRGDITSFLLINRFSEAAFITILSKDQLTAINNLVVNEMHSKNSHGKEQFYWL